jgi:hypothetical protein
MVEDLAPDASGAMGAPTRQQKGGAQPPAAPPLALSPPAVGVKLPIGVIG